MKGKRRGILGETVSGDGVRGGREANVPSDEDLDTLESLAHRW